jgi:hypothetical protein
MLIESDTGDSCPVNIEFRNGQIVERSQLNDYAFRGPTFSHMNFVDFCTSTRDVLLKEHELVIGNQDTNKRRGRPFNARSRYRTGHPCEKTHVRMARTAGHRYLPSFVGASFAAHNQTTDRSLYCASMMVLFRPWNTWDDVIQWSFSWEANFDQFLATSPNRIVQQIRNTQLQRESKEAAEHRQELEANTLNSRADVTDVLDLDDAVTDNVQQHNINPLPDSYLETAAMRSYTQGAIDAGIKCGLLDVVEDFNRDFEYDTASSDISQLENWLTLMKRPPLTLIDAASRHNLPSRFPPAVIPDIDLHTSNRTASIPDQQSTPPSPLPNVHNLNSHQRIAYNIIESHVQQTLAKLKPSQLLMKVMGDPGVGKSRVIGSVDHLFKSIDSSHLLQICAHSGVAASLIGGETLCSIFRMRLNSVGKYVHDKPPGIASKTVDALIEKWKTVEYIIIDEISQVST